MRRIRFAADMIWHDRTSPPTPGWLSLTLLDCAIKAHALHLFCDKARGLPGASVSGEHIDALVCHLCCSGDGVEVPQGLLLAPRRCVVAVR